MKFFVNQASFSNAINQVARAISARPTHPILNCFLVEAKEDNLIITGSDLSIWIKTEIAAEIREEGSICVSARALVDSINKIPNCDLEIKVNTDETTLNIKHKTGKFKINGVSSAEYATFPSLEESEEISLSAEKLLEGLKSVLFSASSDETKQVLTGVNFQYKNEKMCLATTDGHRLSVFSYESKETINACTIPAKVLHEIIKIVKPYSVFQLTFSESIAKIQSDNTTVVFRTLQGNYPNYSQLIPRQFERECCISRKQLIETLERVNIMSDSKNNIVKMTFVPDEQKVELTTENQGVGSAIDTLNCDFSGSPIVICFNAKYILEALKSLNGEEVRLQMNQELTPVILSKMGDPDNLRLLMPIQLRQ
jgi:DNA polymerase-3 subunit beta